jgi:class 3 adenylate cyclase
MTPAEVAERLGRDLGLVAESGGTVDKHIGDTVMAFWNAPRPVEGHPYLALVTALRCLERVRATDLTTLFGDGVNLASRLDRRLRDEDEVGEGAQAPRERQEPWLMRSSPPM